MSPADLLATTADGIPSLLVEFGILLVGLGILARVAAKFGFSRFHFPSGRPRIR